MVAKSLMAASAGIPSHLGSIHLIYTFWGPQLTPRDPVLQAAMSPDLARLTRETTMWKVWVGVNIATAWARSSLA
jgi:hypothetical protein